jgi:acetyltransferase-like isoleucine patch superfamily enzyme
MSATSARGVLGTGAIGLYRLAVRARTKAFTLTVAGAFESLGARSVLELPLRIDGERRMRIGSGVYIGSGCWLQVVDDANLPGNGVAISIGDGTSIAGNCVLSAASSIEVGAHALFARGVYVADHSHGYDDPARPVLDQGITNVAPVVIGDGAWLGENVVVLPGVRIGRGAVVGANAVVTTDVADHAVVVGAPAREVRRFGPGS